MKIFNLILLFAIPIILGYLLYRFWKNKTARIMLIILFVLSILWNEFVLFMGMIFRGMRPSESQIEQPLNSNLQILQSGILKICTYFLRETFYLILFFAIPIILGCLLYRFGKNKTARILLIILLVLIVALDTLAVIFTLNFDSGINRSREKAEVETINREATNRQPQTYEVGLTENYDKCPKIKMDSATKDDFEKLQNLKSFVQNGIKRDECCFYLPTSYKTLKFRDYDKIKDIKDYESDGDKGAEYLGFYPKLQMHAIKTLSVGESMGFAEFVFINNTNADRYEIISFGDDSVEMPVLSSSAKYMVYLQNPEYENTLTKIGVLKIGDPDSKDFLKEYAIGEIESDHQIVEVRWKTDKIFYIKAEKTNGDDSKTYKYYKAEF